jgi:hypothetical protein
VRSLEDRSGSDREVIFADCATIEASPIAHLNMIVFIAEGASNLTFPASIFQIHPCGFFVRKHLHKLVGADRDFIVHGRFLPFSNLSKILNIQLYFISDRRQMETIKYTILKHNIHHKRNAKICVNPLSA